MTATMLPGQRPRVSGRGGLESLVAAVATPIIVVDHLPDRVAPGTTPLMILNSGDAAPAVDSLLDHVRAGGRAVAAMSPAAISLLPRLVTDLPPVVGHQPLAIADDTDPLVFDSRLTAAGVAPATSGRHITADDFSALSVPGSRVLFVANGHPVAVEVTLGAGVLVLIGSTHLLGDRWIAAADNADILHWALTGHWDRRAGETVRRHRPAEPTHHSEVPTVDAAHDGALLRLRPERGTPVGSTPFLSAAGRAGRLLPAAVHDALVDFADVGNDAGALLIRGLHVGELPATPASPVTPSNKDIVSEFVLLTVARRLGQPVGYQAEHGGDIIQNLLPTRAHADRQTSTSSNVQLEFHTETAFHRHKPRFLLLLCLRGDPTALTLLCSIREVLDELPLGVRQILSEPRFRTGVDESFTGERSDRLGRPVPVLDGSEDQPTFTFDADLMVGMDDEAAAALEELRQVIRERHIGIALEAGDLLVVDNAVSVHGRSPFPARFDGTDRWLQRTFVVADLAASAGERTGRVITTRFS